MTVENIAFVHGFLGGPADWDRVRGLLGCESRPITIPQSNDWDDAINTIASSLSDQTDLVGYSMGGRLAIGCAIAMPQKVRRLVVVSANPGINETERSDRLRHDRDIAMQLRSCTTKLQLRTFLDSWYRQKVFAGLAESQIEHLVNLRRDIDVSHMAALIETVSIAVQPDYRDALRSIAVDTLFVAGDRDTKYTDIAQSAARLSSRISCDIILNCGHAIPFERPDELAETIRRFVEA